MEEKLNLIKIAEGFKNLLKNGIGITDQTLDPLAKARLKICKDCIEYSDTNEGCSIPLVTGCCKLCGCYMEAKVRVLDYSCSDKENPKW